jgi:hypothetical protein
MVGIQLRSCKKTGGYIFVGLTIKEYRKNAVFPCSNNNHCHFISEKEVKLLASASKSSATIIYMKLIFFISRLTYYREPLICVTMSLLRLTLTCIVASSSKMTKMREEDDIF